MRAEKPSTNSGRMRRLVVIRPWSPQRGSTVRGRLRLILGGRQDPQRGTRRVGSEPPWQPMAQIAEFSVVLMQSGSGGRI